MDLKKYISDFRNALFRLEEAYSKAINSKETEYYEFFRDSVIQRFEFSVEIMWKSIKKFLEVREGIICRSPKSCIRELFSSGLISEKDTVKLLRMIDDRNRTVHTYHEEIAEEIFKNVASYIPLMKKVCKILDQEA
jgi:nucleotidyltransferase substrate binding protein (TIGR01987 family)